LPYYRLRRTFIPEQMMKSEESAAWTTARFQQSNVEYDGEVMDYHEEEDLDEETTHEEIQEQIDVVDDVELPTDSVQLAAPFHTYNNHGYGGSVDLQDMFRQMDGNEWQTNDQMMDQFLSDPAIGYPLDVLSLVREASNSNPEQNAQMIASLAMQVNFLKSDLSKMRKDITDLRSVCLSNEQSMYSNRRFSPLAQCSREWRIPVAPPLREVDLVKEARAMNINGGKRMLKNRDAIGRFVKIILDKLIPEPLVRDYTVKDRGQSSQSSPKDIGVFTKEQITGIVLDLMGLYNTTNLDHRGRTDRAQITLLVNKCMKAAIYDKRRIAPKRKALK